MYIKNSLLSCTFLALIISTTPVNAAGIAPALTTPAALGGMYAGKITLIGTEAGLGVRNAGVMNAATGNLILTADGQLQNTGSMIVNGDLTVATSATISNSGTL